MCLLILVLFYNKGYLRYFVLKKHLKYVFLHSQILEQILELEYEEIKAVTVLMNHLCEKLEKRRLLV